MTSKQKLDLAWIWKDNTVKVEPRILVHDGTKDCGDKPGRGENDLLALKAFVGRF